MATLDFTDVHASQLGDRHKHRATEHRADIHNLKEFRCEPAPRALRSILQTCSQVRVSYCQEDGKWVPGVQKDELLVQQGTGTRTHSVGFAHILGSDVVLPDERP